MPPPPRWLQNWKRFLFCLLQAEKFLIRCMCQAVKLRLRTKAWLVHQDPMDMAQQAMLMEKLEGPCAHDHIQRSGNRHGRYSKCLVCGKKWRWNEDRQQWEDPPPSRRGPQQLPLPSSSTAARFEDPSFTPNVFLGIKPKPLEWTLTPSTPPMESKIPEPKKTQTEKQKDMEIKAKKKEARSKARAQPAKREVEQDMEAEMSEVSDVYDWDLVEASP